VETRPEPQDPQRDPSSQHRRPLARRRFLALGAAGGVSAVLGGLGWRHRPAAQRAAEDEDGPFDLRDAAGPPDGERIGTQQVIWSVETAKPVVALTFDDGPDPDLTPRILEILDSFGITATFCAMGRNVADHPELFREVVNRGHEIGNHTWSHVDLAEQSPRRVQHELELAHEAIEWAGGSSVRLFRPPRGRLNDTATRYAARLGYDIALWSVGRGVPGAGTPDAVTEHVLGALQPGDILLLHDGIGRETFRTDLDGRGPVGRRRDVELRALPAILEGALERGLELTTVSGLMEKAFSEQT
jgi:peptidoglycan-N-acetylglucosamine deacetylase